MRSIGATTPLALGFVLHQTRGRSDAHELPQTPIGFVSSSRAIASVFAHEMTQPTAGFVTFLPTARCPLPRDYADYHWLRFVASRSRGRLALVAASSPRP